MTSLLLALLATGTLHAPAPVTPHTIVQALYAPYVARRNGPTDSAEDAIGRYAAPGLKRLIDKDDACMKREQGICNIDFDFLIAGQDGDPSKLKITDDAPTKDAQIVHASFENDGPVELRFHFVRLAGAWKIDDVEALRPKGESFERDIWLKKQLKGQS